MEYILLYYGIFGLIGFIQMGLDKKKAKKHQWRIPEMTLFLTAFIGGSFGSLLGMYVFRHKTKHRSFVIGMPLIVLFHVAVILFLKAYFLA